MIAASSPHPSPRRRSLALIQGSLSARRVARQAPWLAALHKATDGILLALGASVLGLAALTLHWQGQWTRSFHQLETSQLLEHQLQESTSALEHHHLSVVRRPGQLVPTSIQKLVYVPAPGPAATAPSGQLSVPPLSSVSTSLTALNRRSIRPGY